MNRSLKGVLAAGAAFAVFAGAKAIGAAGGYAAAHYAVPYAEGALAGAPGKTGREVRIDAIIDDLEKDAVMGTMYHAFRAEFPAEYTRMTDEMRELIKGGSSPDAAKAHMQAYMQKATKPLYASIPSAPIDLQKDVVLQRVTLYRHLRSQSPDVCGRVVTSGPYAGMPDNADTLKAVSAIGAAQMRAAGAGRRHPQAYPAPTSDGYASMQKALTEQGVTPEQIEVLSNGTLMSTSMAERCDILVVLYDALLAMPPQHQRAIMPLMLKD